MCDKSDAESLLKLLRQRLATFRHYDEPTVDLDGKTGRIQGAYRDGSAKRDFHAIYLVNDRTVDRNWAMARIIDRAENPSSSESLIRALNAPYPAIRVAAAFLLLERKSSELDETLWLALIRDYHSPYYRWVRETVNDLIKSGQAEKPLAATLRSDDWFVRLMAAEALMPIRRKEALDVLVPALKDRDPWCRIHALKALDRTMGPEDVDVFLPLLTDNCWVVRMYAVGALQTRNTPKSVQAVAGALGDPDEYVRRHAAMALCEMNASEVADKLIGALKDQNDYIGQTVATAITGADKFGGRDVFRRALAGEDATIRARAIALLAPRLPAADVMQPVIAALNDPSADVRYAAVCCLSEIGDADAVGPLSKLLDDTDERVRKAAKQALDNIRKRQRK